MSECHINTEVRLGRYLFYDAIRAVGGGQYFLCNIVHATELGEPYLADILGMLSQVGHLYLEDSAFGGISYRLMPGQVGVDRGMFQVPLTPSEADAIVDSVCTIAERLNGDERHPYTYQCIFLFGSHLRGATSPNDVDLGVSASYRDGPVLPEPSYYPFGPKSIFHYAVTPLANRRARKISLHHVKEMEAIQTPYRLVWSAEKGRDTNSIIITPPIDAERVRELAERKKRHAAHQKTVDRLVARINSTTKWNEAIRPEVGDAKPISEAQWKKLRFNNALLAMAHHACIPPGILKEQATAALVLIEHEFPKSQLTQARKNIGSFLRASFEYNRWSLRPNGRFLRAGA